MYIHHNRSICLCIVIYCLYIPSSTRAPTIALYRSASATQHQQLSIPCLWQWYSLDSYIFRLALYVTPPYTLLWRPKFKGITQSRHIERCILGNETYIPISHWHAVNDHSAAPKNGRLDYRSRTRLDTVYARFGIERLLGRNYNPELMRGICDSMRRRFQCKHSIKSMILRRWNNVILSAKTLHLRLKAVETFARQLVAVVSYSLPLDYPR